MKAAAKKIVRHQAAQLPLDSLQRVLATVKQNRAIVSDDELDLSLKHLLPATKLKNIEQASTLLADVMCAQKNICNKIYVIF